MKNYIEFHRKISSGGGTSTSIRITIPEEIVKKMEITSGENITWRLYDGSNEVTLLFPKETPKTTKKTTSNIHETTKKPQKETNLNQYIKGNKKEGYYIINEEKQINIGAYINKEDLKEDLNNMILNEWNQQSVETSKLNVEYYITEETYPHIRNHNFYYCLTKEDYSKLNEDVSNNTPFQNISYESLQRIIQDSIQFEEVPEKDETSQKQQNTNKEIISTTQTNNKKYSIILQKNPNLEIVIIDNSTQKQRTKLGASKRDQKEIESIITQTKKYSTEDEIKKYLDTYRPQ